MKFLSDFERHEVESLPNCFAPFSPKKKIAVEIPAILPALPLKIPTTFH
jgi:hypothetical protein